MACYCYRLLVGGNMRQWNSEQKMEIIRVEIIIARPWIGTQLTRSSFCHSLPNLIFVGTHEYFVNILNRLLSLELVGWRWGECCGKGERETIRSWAANPMQIAEHDIGFRLDKGSESDWSASPYLGSFSLCLSYCSLVWVKSDLQQALNIEFDFQVLFRKLPHSFTTT